MGFSELRLIADDTGLSYDGERGLLYGEKHGYGVTVIDSGNEYEIKLFCTQPHKLENEVFAAVNGLSESLPKNTVMKQSCEYGYILVVLNKYMLLQENIVFLIEFLEKLAAECEELGLTPEKYSLPKAEKPAAASPADDRKGERVKLGFGARSLLGLLGAVLGAAAVTVLSILLVDANAEAKAFGLSSEISSYLVSAAATALIFFDYVFLSKKLDAFGVIVCPLLSLGAVYLSAFGAGVKALCALENAPPAAVIAAFAELTEKHDVIDKFVMGYLTRGLLLAAAASIFICVWYFRRHPNETTDSEKIIPHDENQRK